VIVAVSASGTTRYVLAAAAVGRQAGSLVIAVSAAGSPMARDADVAIELEVGPEVIAGSSRLKSGTAQKVVLNMLSTGVFTRLGHTYRGRMVGVAAANDKQRRRAVRLVTELTGAGSAEVAEALHRSRWNSKIAVIMLRCDLSSTDAAALLERSDGDLSAALGERTPA
jgi:N-acetylmuramic acid 6-phosphate etherase